MVSVEAIKARKAKIAVIGLGYVGLPLAAAFSRQAEVIGYDISEKKIRELERGHDATGELSAADLRETRIVYTRNATRLKEAAFFVVTVPTPIDEHHTPDLRPVVSARTHHRPEPLQRGHRRL